MSKAKKGAGGISEAPTPWEGRHAPPGASAEAQAALEEDGLFVAAKRPQRRAAPSPEAGLEVEGGIKRNGKEGGRSGRPELAVAAPPARAVVEPARPAAPAREPRLPRHPAPAAPAAPADLPPPPAREPRPVEDQPPAGSQGQPQPVQAGPAPSPALRKRGRPKRAEAVVVRSVRLTPRVDAMLRDLAEARGLDLNGAVSVAIAEDWARSERLVRGGRGGS